MNDYITKDQYEQVWLGLSGVQSTGTSLRSNGDVDLHFPDEAACKRLLSDPGFTRMVNEFKLQKSIVRQAKLGEV